MRYGTFIVFLLAIGCNFSQQFQLPGAGDAGAPFGDAGCGSTSDPNNCGTCGHSCLGGECNAGKCAPIVLASGQGDSASGASWYPYLTDAGDPLDGPDRIAVDATYVYWLNLRGEVMRVSIMGGDPERIARTPPAPAWIELDDRDVYFSTLDAAIYRVAKTGGAPELLVPSNRSRPAIMLLPGQPYPTEFRVAGDQLQWSDGSGVYACPVSSCKGAVQTLYAGSADYRPFSFAMDSAGKMYASEEDHQSTGPDTESVSYTLSVYRDGQWPGIGGPTAYYELHGGDHEVYAFATTDFGPRGVVRWSESSVTFLASGDAVPGAARSLALDDAFAYWPNAAANEVDRLKRTASVVRCQKVGCASPEVLAADQLVPRGVAVANGVVYWTTGDGNVMKLASPGSGAASPIR